jgi:hypothetical protein
MNGAAINLGRLLPGTGIHFNGRSADLNEAAPGIAVGRNDLPADTTVASRSSYSLYADLGWRWAVAAQRAGWGLSSLVPSTPLNSVIGSRNRSSQRVGPVGSAQFKFVRVG